MKVKTDIRSEISYERKRLAYHKGQIQDSHLKLNELYHGLGILKEKFPAKTVALWKNDVSYGFCENHAFQIDRLAEIFGTPQSVKRLKKGLAHECSCCIIEHNKSIQ